MPTEDVIKVRALGEVIDALWNLIQITHLFPPKTHVSAKRSTQFLNVPIPSPPHD
jgi:hypothetical protein